MEYWIRVSSGIERKGLDCFAGHIGNMWMLQSFQGTSIGDIRHKFVFKQALLVPLLTGKLAYGDLC